MSSKTENKTALYLATWPFSKMADVEENTVNDRDDQFLSFLKKTSLENFKDAFIKQGVEKIEHLQDIDEEDAKEFGLSKFQLKRLKREYALGTRRRQKVHHHHQMLHVLLVPHLTRHPVPLWCCPYGPDLRTFFTPEMAKEISWFLQKP